MGRSAELRRRPKISCRSTGGSDQFDANLGMAAPFHPEVAALDRSTDIGPKALRAHKVAPVVGALVAIGVAVLLYRGQRDAGFAILAVLSGASGWLLSGRVARLVCLGEVIALAGCFWWASLPWATGLVQL